MQNLDIDSSVVITDKKFITSNGILFEVGVIIAKSFLIIPSTICAKHKDATEIYQIYIYCVQFANGDSYWFHKDSLKLKH